MSYTPIAPKSCITCVSRKVKCGMEEPNCLRCSKANLECAGYVRRPFIIVPPSQAKTGKKYKTRPRTARKAPATSGSVCQQSKRPTISLKSEHKSHALIRLQLISHFLDIYCPPLEDMDPGQRQSLCLLPQYWVHVLPTLKYTLPALQASTMALVCTYLGAITANEEYSRRGLQLYSQALNLIAKSLSHPKEVADPELLIAVYVMTATDTFEVPHGPNPGWIAHTQAAYRLLESRASTLKNCGEETRAMYNMIRKQHIYHGVVSRRTSPFSRPCWAKIAPAMLQNHYERMVHIMLKYGVLLEMLDIMEVESDRHAKLDLLLSIDAKLMSQLNEYRQWYRDFVEENGVSVKCLPNDAFPECKQLLASAHFDESFMFDNFLISQSLTHLWCGHLFLIDVSAHSYRAAMELDPQLSSSFGFSKYLLQEEELFDIFHRATFSGLWDKADLLAKMVCMSVPYHTKSGMGLLAGNSTIPITWTARKYFSTRVSLGHLDYVQRRDWCEQALDDMARRRMKGASRAVSEEREFDGRSGYRKFLSP